MTKPPQPTHRLADIKRAVRDGNFELTYAAFCTASSLGFDSAAVCQCILSLTASDFHKTMESEKHPGHWQDVYRTQYADHRLYVKLELGKKAVVISFKTDERAR